MRMRGSSVRFIMVSATAPNVQDIAAWIGSVDKSKESAKVFEVRVALSGLVVF